MLRFSLRSGYPYRHLALRYFSLLLLGLLIVLPASYSHARESYTIGMSLWSGYPENVRGFKDGLAEAGLTEGVNLRFIEAQTVADKMVQRSAAQEFLNQNVDLVYSLTTPGTSAVKEVIAGQLPIVFSIVTYPADSGLIDSFEYSGNNLVGTSNYVPLPQYIKLLKLIAPNTQSAAVFHRKGEPNSKIQSSNLIRLLKRAGIKTYDQEATDLDQLKQMAIAISGKVDLFITTTDTLMQSGGEDLLIEISKASNTPILSSNKAGILNGSTFGPVADFYTLGKMAGRKAAKILIEDASPASLSSEHQSPPLFLANKSSLKALNLTLSDQAKKMIILVE